MLAGLKFVPREKIGKVSPIIEVYEYCILFVYLILAYSLSNLCFGIIRHIMMMIRMVIL